MGDDFNLEKELAPATQSLVSGNVEGATAALAAVLVRFATGSSAAAAGAEALVARAIARSSEAQLKNEYQTLEQETKEATLRNLMAAHLHVLGRYGDTPQRTRNRKVNPRVFDRSQSVLRRMKLCFKTCGFIRPYRARTEESYEQ